MAFPSYRNKSAIDPSQALIDPQIDEGELRYSSATQWRQLLLRAGAVSLAVS